MHIVPYKRLTATVPMAAESTQERQGSRLQPVVECHPFPLEVRDLREAQTPEKPRVTPCPVAAKVGFGSSGAMRV